MTLPRRLVNTAHGQLQLWGHLDRFDPARPLVLCIRGVFTGPDQYAELPEVLPDADVVLADLPGMDAPHFDNPSVANFAAAFDELLRRDHAGRRAMVFGISAGGLVALAMEGGQAKVVLDPPLASGAAWPLFPFFAKALAKGDSGLEDWLWQVFGFSLQGIESRNYLPLIDRLTVPTLVIVPSDPLEPQRLLNRLPGLITAEDRAALSASPKVQVVNVPGGHNVIDQNPQSLARALRIGLALAVAGSTVG